MKKWIILWKTVPYGMVEVACGLVHNIPGVPGHVDICFLFQVDLFCSCNLLQSSRHFTITVWTRGHTHRHTRTHDKLILLYKFGIQYFPHPVGQSGPQRQSREQLTRKALFVLLLKVLRSKVIFMQWRTASFFFVRRVTKIEIRFRSDCLLIKVIQNIESGNNNGAYLFISNNSDSYFHNMRTPMRHLSLLYKIWTHHYLQFASRVAKASHDASSISPSGSTSLTPLSYSKAILSNERGNSLIWNLPNTKISLPPYSR